MRLSLLVAAVFAAAPLEAQLGGLLKRPDAPADTAADTAAATQRVDDGSPRAAVVAYILAVREGRADDAAAFLVLPDSAEEPARLARRLKAVLDTYSWLDVARLSPAAAGDTADGLPRNLEEIGRIETGKGVPRPVRMERSRTGTGPAWRFTAETVEQIDGWYATLPDRWIREHLPTPLQREGPLALRWWQWIALVLLVPLSLAIALPLVRPTRRFLASLVARTETTFDDELLALSKRPLTLLWALLVVRLSIGWIALPAPAHAAALTVQRVLLVIAVFWILLRAVQVVQRGLPQSEWGTRNPGLKSLIPLMGRVVRLFLVLIGTLAVLAQLGYNVGALLAGLGIGGIAVALAAQKTLEHFFGSVSIGVDQPFRVGDFVRVEDIMGEIEAIGLRSTRIRSLDRSLISIPNGRLADMRTENFGARDRFRMLTTVGVTYGTPAATIRSIRDDIEALLRAQPETWPDAVVVRFSAFNAYSMDFEIMCWFLVPTFNDFREVRERVLLGIMEIIERNGASFALPTQTIHVASAPPAARQSVPI